jgi:thioredoxin 1
MSSLSREPLEYGDRDLPSLIHRSAEPVVVESHYAGWDSEWRGLSPEAWETLARELGGRIRCARLETGRNRGLAVRYGLEIIPTVLVFCAGEVIARFTGSVRAADVIEAVRAALQRSHAVESARRELEIVHAREKSRLSARSVLRRRTASRPVLARAG